MSKTLKLLTILLIIVFAITGCTLIERAKDDHVFRIVLDAGHGGHDPGAVAGDVYEKDINLAVLLLVQEKLNERIIAEGIGEKMVVYTTRDTDEFIPLSDRAKFANKHNADFFISIHSNSLGENSEVNGVITFYHPNKKADKTNAAIIQKYVLQSCGGTDRGINSANYAVIRETDMNAVLLEIGFMSCPEELEKLIDPEYQDLIAQGIVNGIFNIYQES